MSAQNDKYKIEPRWRVTKRPGEKGRVISKGQIYLGSTKNKKKQLTKFQKIHPNNHYDLQTEDHGFSVLQHLINGDKL